MRRAVCTGSFDPVTLGHIDIFERAASLFDELLVCVFVSVKKPGLFPVEERVRLLRESVSHIKNIRVDAFSGLVVDYLRLQDAHYIVRGLRPGDFDYEAASAYHNSRLYPGTETVFLMCRPEYAYISSSTVRELAHFGGSIEGLVPTVAQDAIKRLVSEHK